MLKTYEPYERKIPFWLNEKESRVYIPHSWILELGKPFIRNPTTKLHQKIGQLYRTPPFQRRMKMKSVKILPVIRKMNESLCEMGNWS